MRTLLLVLLAAALGASSAFLVACGDRNSLIPPSDASAIQSDLDRAADDHAAEECRRAQRHVIRAQDRAQRLPAEVDSDLRKTLTENLEVVLRDIVASCGKTQSTQSTQTTATTPTTPTETTTTEAPPTTTESGGTPPGGPGSGGDSGGETP